MGSLGVSVLDCSNRIGHFSVFFSLLQHGNLLLLLFSLLLLFFLQDQSLGSLLDFFVLNRLLSEGIVGSVVLLADQVLCPLYQPVVVTSGAAVSVTTSTI